jgi:hypothetical protein
VEGMSSRREGQVTPRRQRSASSIGLQPPGETGRPAADNGHDVALDTCVEVEQLPATSGGFDIKMLPPAFRARSTSASSSSPPPSSPPWAECWASEDHSWADEQPRRGAGAEPLPSVQHPQQTGVNMFVHKLSVLREIEEAGLPVPAYKIPIFTPRELEAACVVSETEDMRGGELITALEKEGQGPGPAARGSPAQDPGCPTEPWSSGCHGRRWSTRGGRRRPGRSWGG